MRETAEEKKRWKGSGVLQKFWFQVSVKVKRVTLQLYTVQKESHSICNIPKLLIQ